MTFTISIYQGYGCKAVTCLNCVNLWDAVLKIAESYPDWDIDTIREGW